MLATGKNTEPVATVTFQLNAEHLRQKDTKMSLNIDKKDLQDAVRKGLLDNDQVDGLWTWLNSRNAPAPANKSEVQNLFWYSGAGIVLLAMSWFMLQSWTMFSGGGLLALALTYAGLFTMAGAWLLRKPDLKTPGGLMITLAVVMVPLAVFGVEQMLGMWSQVANVERDMPPIRNLLMEGATVLAALLAIRFVRFPFLGLPVAFSLWLMTLELVTLAAGVNGISWQTQEHLTLGFGIVMIAAAFAIDKMMKEDFAFWGYFFGVTAFWFALGSITFVNGSETSRLIWALINVALVPVAVLLKRTVFLTYGALGIVGYLGYLTFSVFASTLLFPLYLTGLGVGVICLGVLYHRYQDSIESTLLGLLPETVRKALPQARN